jgi:hypothetical protein
MEEAVSTLMSVVDEEAWEMNLSFHIVPQIFAQLMFY